VVEIVLRSDLSELNRLAEAVEEFGRQHALPDATMAQVGLALDELVTNVITYGYGIGASGTIQLRLAVADDWLEAELIDEAPAFDPFTAPEPDLDAPLEERQVGGLGVHFVRTFLDHVDYVRDGKQNRVTLGKRLAPDGPTP